MGIEKCKTLKKAIKSENIPANTGENILPIYYRVLIAERSCRCGKI
jgi:hypothetical protein